MATVPPGSIDLRPGERALGSWPVDRAGAEGDVVETGWLVLTDQRLLYFRRPGRWGSSRPERTPVFERSLEAIRSLEVRRAWMRIGYGDRIEIPGLAIDELWVRLNREIRDTSVLRTIEEARVARRGSLSGGTPP